MHRRRSPGADQLSIESNRIADTMRASSKALPAAQRVSQTTSRRGGPFASRSSSIKFAPRLTSSSSSITQLCQLAHIRHFHVSSPFLSSASASSSSSSTPTTPANLAAPSATKDPDHPYLWYHPSIPTDRTALSFLPDSPSQGSRTTLGHLPLQGDSGLNDFTQNDEFLCVASVSLYYYYLFLERKLKRGKKLN